MDESKRVGLAGEHWVCAALARRGWAPTMMHPGFERTDVLAVGTHLADRPRIEIQVKSTNQSTGRAWTGSSRNVAKSDHEWFVYVGWPPASPHPETFVVPRDHVVAAFWISHYAWLTDPAALRSRNTPDTQSRLDYAVWEGYRDRWDLLDHPASGAAVLLPPALRATALLERVGLPPGHPWISDLPRW